MIVVFLEVGSLPEEDKRAQVIALTQSQFSLSGSILRVIRQGRNFLTIPIEGPLLLTSEMLLWCSGSLCSFSTVMVSKTAYVAPPYNQLVVNPAIAR